jgi:hypothetical protein
MGGVHMEENYQVVYTDLLSRGITIKIENKLVLGIGDEKKKESA